jgi:hypothetical protein
MSDHLCHKSVSISRLTSCASVKSCGHWFQCWLTGSLAKYKIVLEFHVVPGNGSGQQLGKSSSMSFGLKQGTFSFSLNLVMGIEHTHEKRTLRSIFSNDRCSVLQLKKAGSNACYRNDK